jgi:membrane protease YdiL (CAAX protease family)
MSPRPESGTTALHTRAGTHAGILVAIALLSKFFWLSPPAEILGDWAPPLFLVTLTIAGIAFQRRFLVEKPTWMPTIPTIQSQAFGNYGTLGLALVPALVGGFYSIAIQGWQGVLVDFQRPVSAFVAALLYIVAAPMVEEFYFRHILHREIATLFHGSATVACVNAIWFAAIHAPYNMPLALVTGLCCTVLRSRTGGLGWPVLAHSFTNLILEILQR